MQALQKQVKLLRQLSETLQRENQSRNKEKDTLLQQIQHLMEENDSLHRQISQLKNNPNQNPQGNAKEKQKQLESKVRALQANQDKYQQQLQDLRTRLDNQFIENDRIKNQLLDTKGQMLKEKDQVIVLQNQVKKLKQKVEDMNQQNLGSTDKSREDVMSLKLKITELNEQINKENQEVEHLLAEYTEQKAISESIAQKLKRADQEVSRLRQLLNSRQNSEYRQVTHYQGITHQTEKQNSRIQQLQRDFEEKMKENEVLNRKVGSLESEIIELNERILKMTDQNDQIIQKELRNQHAKSTAEILELTKMIGRRQQQIQILKRRQENEIKSHYKTIEDSLIQSQKMLQQAQNQLIHKQTQEAAAKTEISKLKDELNAINNQNNSLCTVIGEQKSYINTLQSKLHSLEQNKGNEIEEIFSNQLRIKDQQLNDLRQQLSQAHFEYTNEIQQNAAQNDFPYKTNTSPYSSGNSTKRQNSKLVSLITNLKHSNQAIKNQIRNSNQMHDGYGEIKKIKNYHSNQDFHVQQEEEQQSIKDIVRSLQVQLNNVKSNFNKIEAQNSRLHSFIKSKFDDDSLDIHSQPGGLLHRNKSNLLETMQNRERRGDTEGSQTSQPKYIRSNPKTRASGRNQSWKFPQRDETKPRRPTYRPDLGFLKKQGNNEQPQRETGSKKWEKWSNLEKRINMLQQENRELKKTLQN